ncbi:MAG: M23 family metallopeptidase [Ktedonobacteraceae bacterium]
MFSSPDRHITNVPPQTGHRSLKTMKLPPESQQEDYHVITNPRYPIVIPAATRRKHTEPLEHSKYRRGRFIFPGILLGSVLVITLAMVFVVPLDNTSQHSRTLAQAIGSLISNQHLNEVDTLQQLSTPTSSLFTGGSSCGGNDIWGTCATYITASGVMGSGQMLRPIKGTVITQPFGHPEYQLWCGCWKPHTGIDLAAPYGTPVTAADNGQVIWVGWDWSGLGWAVKINHGDYIATIYGHLDHLIVKVGQNVAVGQIIGYEGSTGASTGPHVHFMVLVHNIWVDPTLYVQLP